uniref:At2g23090-like zinc-binding domain-containing protein n=1 Tax=Eutreptiella gymnastica TaxID=73025 RepID=A0A7S4CPR2_9EUGL
MSMSKLQQKLYKKEKEAKEKARANAGKQLQTPEGKAKAAKDQQAYKCGICMQTFMCTTKPAQLQQHCENKHPKADIAKCFPELPGLLAG